MEWLFGKKKTAAGWLWVNCGEAASSACKLLLATVMHTDILRENKRMLDKSIRQGLLHCRNQEGHRVQGTAWLPGTIGGAEAIAQDSPLLHPQ